MNNELQLELYLKDCYVVRFEDGSESLYDETGVQVIWRGWFPLSPMGDEMWTRLTQGLRVVKA